MATRGAYGVRLDAEDRVLLNFRDTHPDLLGVQFAAEAEELAADPIGLTAKVRAVRLVDPSAAPTPAERALWDVPNRRAVDWYDVTRGCQGRLAPFLDVGIVPDRQDFLLDGLACEYAYIINLDTGLFEIYEGRFNVPGPGRYGRQVKCLPQLLGEQVYGVHLVAELPLSGVASSMEVYVKLNEVAGC